MYPKNESGASKNCASQFLLAPFSFFVDHYFYIFLNLNDSNAVSMVIYNPLAWTSHRVIPFEVPRNDIIVVDVEDNIIPSEIHTGINSSYVLFVEVNIPPLGYVTYFAKTSSQANFIPRLAR